MPATALGRTPRIEQPNAAGFTITDTPGTNAWSAWLEVITATEHDASGLIYIARQVTSANDYLFEVGIGGSGSEVTLIPGIHISNLLNHEQIMRFPVFIPKGSRISVRSRSNTVGNTIGHLMLMSSGPLVGPMACSRIDAMGLDLANHRGTTVDPGATVSTWGSWTRMGAAELTDFPVRYVWLTLGLIRNTAIAGGNFIYEIAATPDAAATIANGLIVGPMQMRTQGTANTMITPAWYGPFEVQIPAGWRIYVRAMASINDATDRLMSAVVHVAG